MSFAGVRSVALYRRHRRVTPPRRGAVLQLIRFRLKGCVGRPIRGYPRIGGKSTQFEGTPDHQSRLM